MSDKKQDALLRAKQLKANRLDWEGHWKDITDYILPRKGRYDGDQVNKPKTSAKTRVDSTATKSLRVLASGMQGGLTSPSRPWFRLTTPDPGLSDFSPVKLWLAQVERLFYAVFSRSNFYGAIHGLYTELGAFGTAALYSEELSPGFLVFHSLTTGTYAIGSGEDGRIDSIYREYYLPARTLLNRYGKNKVTMETVSASNGQPDKLMKCCHIIFPRQDMDPEKIDSWNKPIASLKWQYGSGQNDILSESGFDEMPVQVARWDVTADDLWGQSPGLDALPDVKMLQQMVKAQAMLLQQAVKPATQKPPSMKGRVNTNPGAENIVDVTGPDGKITTIFDPRLEAYNAISDRINSVQIGVREWFFNDLFLMLTDRPNMTATEVMERHEEKMLMLGPVIERQQYELLDPLIERMFNVLWRARMIPPPPQELAGRELKVEYISLLAQAQKMTGVKALEAATAYAQAVGQADPMAMLRFNGDAAIQEHADMLGVHPRVLRSDDDVKKIVEAQAKAAQEQQAMEQQAMAASTAKDATRAAETDRDMTQQITGV